MNAQSELERYAGLALSEGAPDFASRWAMALEGSGREAAVLMLFGPQEDKRGQDSYRPEDLDLLLLERAPTLGKHAGEVAFPGGSVDPEDTDHVAAALREAVEETGLDVSGVDVFGALPAHALPYSNFLVTPVLAWWREPSPVRAVDPGESSSVFRIPVRDLLDPANRVTARLERGGTVFKSPGFLVGEVFVWGFTGKLIDETLHFLGWEQPWETRNYHRFEL